MNLERDKVFWELKEIVEEQAKAKYGNELPKIIKERIQQELHQIDLFNQEYNLAEQIIVVWELTTKLKEEKYLYFAKVDMPNSLIFYLLGVTSTNPLPPHYYCKKCKQVEWVSEEIDGFDLADKTCACGNIMIGDGHNLAYEFMWGVEDEKGRLEFHINIAQKKGPMIRKFFHQHRYMKDVTPEKMLSTEQYGSIYICCYADSIYSAYEKEVALEDLRRFYTENIKGKALVNIEKQLNCLLIKESTKHPGPYVLNGLERYPLAEHITIESFKELIWWSGAGDLWKKYKSFLSENIKTKEELYKYPVFYDDFYDIFIKEHTPKDALRLSKKFHTAYTGVEDSVYNKVPKEIREGAKNIEYLFAKGGDIELFLMKIRNILEKTK